MKRLILLIAIFTSIVSLALAQSDSQPFITTWNVPSEAEFTIPLSDNQTYDFEFFVIQESGTVFSGQHTNENGAFIFGSIESVTVELHIYGQFPHFASYSKNLLLDVNQWGDIVWESMNSSFEDWSGEGFSATDAPNLGNVTNMRVLKT